MEYIVSQQHNQFGLIDNRKKTIAIDEQSIMQMDKEQLQQIITAAKLAKKRLQELSPRQRKDGFTSDGRPIPQAADPIASIEDYHRIVNYYLDKDQYRNAMLVVLGVLFGERCGDLLSIKFSDIMTTKGSFKNQFRIYEEKTSKYSQYIALPEGARFAIEMYLESKNNEYNINDYLFTDRSGNKLGYDGAYKVLKQAKKDLNLNYNVSTHTLRKSYATFARLADPENATLENLQFKYNHTDSRITMRYLPILKQITLDTQNKMSEFLS